MAGDESWVLTVLFVNIRFLVALYLSRVTLDTYYPCQLQIGLDLPLPEKVVGLAAAVLDICRTR